MTDSETPDSRSSSPATGSEWWPSLAVDSWAPTRETLHRWMQIVGKVQLVSSPLINEWWNVAFLLSARGLRTNLMLDKNATFDAEFDFVDHQLVFRSSSGGQETIALRPMTVAAFWNEVQSALGALGVDVELVAHPNEVSPSIPFAEDTTNASYDAAAVHTFWRQLLSAARVFEEFRGSFGGKQSPVQLFWGSFDLSQVRFSGRPAPAWEGTLPPACPHYVMQEAEGMENSSAGFWCGDGTGEGSFYAYASPAPKGYGEGDLSPAAYSTTAGEWLLPYETVRTSADPDATLLAFLKGTYAKAADLAQWDRATLDLDPNRLEGKIHPQF